MAYATLEFSNFQEIDLALGVRRSLPLALNTVAYRTGVNESEIAISYHGNDIATWDTGTKAITLQTGGWITPTTIDRLNQIARGNDIGVVQKVDGVARFTHRAKDYGWYSMKDRVTIDRDGRVEHNDPDRHGGYSTFDTYQAAVWCDNPEGGESEYKAILNMSRVHLRQYIKLNRNNIGYSTINRVNIREIHNALQEG